MIDFAEVIARPRPQRRQHLLNYLSRDPRGRWKSYNGFIRLVPDIVGVARGLDPSDICTRDDVHRGLRLTCDKADLVMNLEVADVLFDFVRPKRLSAYADHHKSSLRIGPDRTIQMGVTHYVVDGDRGAFQFVHPRRKRMEGAIPDIVMSLIHHNYVRDDFDGFGVEILDLSVEPVVGPRGGIRSEGPRSPRILSLEPSSILSRDELNEDANSVYELLMQIARED